MNKADQPGVEGLGSDREAGREPEPASVRLHPSQEVRQRLSAGAFQVMEALQKRRYGV